MIKSIQIQNLKCFENQSIPLSPLTLLTGYNAAGKSTVIHALLMLAQSARERVLSTSVAANGSLINLGVPSELLRKGAREKLITLKLEADDARATWMLDPRGRTDDKLGARVFASNSVGEEADSAEGESVTSVATSIVLQLKNLLYLSALRVPLVEAYPSPDTARIVHADVGTEGQYAPWWFQRYIDEEVEASQAHSSESSLIFRRQINAWATEIFGLVEFNAIKQNRSRLTSLEIRTSTTEDWRVPINVGYGLMYAFPILVAGLLAKDDQTLIVDSPEAHLHPRAQSRLGMFLAKCADRGVRLIVETHSDHVLNGIRIAVKEKVIRSSDVGIYFFNSRGSENNEIAHVTAPTIGENGDISDWPAGFFDQSESDLNALAGWK